MSLGGKVVIVDFEMGNLRSVQNQLQKLCDQVEVSSDPRRIAQADRLVLPGVGHFSLAMRNLAALDLIDPLHEAVRVAKKPILGICLGLQLMAHASEEGDEGGNVSGLNWLGADVVRFHVSGQRMKVPHMGWNQVHKLQPSRLLSGIAETDEFYFTHSYHLQVGLQTAQNSATVGSTTYEETFPSVVEDENIFGVQFHPEKSRQAGVTVLKNFLAS